MITTNRFAQECKESQRKYMGYAKSDLKNPIVRKSWVQLALMMRRQAREWAAMS
ncbi:hypothetical protein LW139_07145 [Proteus vulgaris]|uniref:hypothetical protein n=1 Tax=Proteus vulgaris TaxID=585 RepID=UPI001FFF96D6|nr:hypothetical protein [Proteus vulgaris]UPK82460.1 hypothetical protein LW139_07145 [Proteus vulgaris]